MKKEEVYELALSDVHKYNLLNEIFAIRDKNIENVNYTIGVDGFISLDVLNQYVNKIDENTNLKQALSEIREYIYENSIPINLLSNPPKETLDFEGDITDILKIIDKYMKEDD